MESVGSSVPASRSQNYTPHKKHKRKEDRISRLPDSLIGHILSFLPTKDAVRTSVLSKTWINKWISITKVELDDDVFYRPKRKKSGGKQHFINFVYKTLLFTNSYCVKSVSLVLTNKYDVAHLNSWISCILNRGVKKIHISTNYELPFSAVTIHSLFDNFHHFEELVLEMSHCAIKVPPVEFNYKLVSLKHLKLCGIIFTIDKSQGIYLPILKKFETINCSWLSAHDVTVELKAPLLESVYIEQDLDSETDEPRRCKIKLSATCVKEFTYCGDGISQPIILSNPSSARNASINISFYLGGYNIQKTGSFACFLLKQFNQVMCFKFHGVKVLTKQNVTTLPLFALLSHLKLDVVNGEVLISLLQKSPVLKTLVTKGISEFDLEILNSTVVPDCLASTLQVVKFKNLYGIEHVLFIAKFLMENGMVLERMSFFFPKWLMVGKTKVMKEFKEKLYSFKKGVSFTILEFSY